MYKAIILPSAKQDIQEATSWYNEQKSKLGKNFTEEIRLKVNLLKTNPVGYSVRYKDVRVASLYKFPFMIHFKIEEIKKTLLIIAVFHTSRNPAIWAKR